MRTTLLWAAGGLVSFEPASLVICLHWHLTSDTYHLCLLCLYGGENSFLIYIYFFLKYFFKPTEGSREMIRTVLSTKPTARNRERCSPGGTLARLMHTTSADISLRSVYSFSWPDWRKEGRRREQQCIIRPLTSGVSLTFCDYYRAGTMYDISIVM